MHILSITSAKGGVGKTTISVHLACAMSLLGVRCLLIDFDPQGAVAPMLGISKIPEEISLTYQLAHGDKLASIEIPSLPNLSVLPSHPKYDHLQMSFEKDSMHTLLRDMECRADFVLFDLSPSMEPLTISALKSSDSALVVVQPNALCVRTVPTLLNTIMQQCKETSIEGILLNQFGVSPALADRLRPALEQAFSSWIFPEEVPADDELQLAFLKGKSVFQCNAQARSATAFFRIAKELIRRHSVSQSGASTPFQQMKGLRAYARS